MRTRIWVMLAAFLGPWAATGWAGEPAHNDLLLQPAEQTARIAASVLMDAAVAGDRLVVVGEAGRIGFSDDGGQTWRQAQVPVSVTLTAVAFPTPRDGWAVGHDGVILHSTDAGATWELQLDGARVNEQVLTQVQGLVADVEARLAAAPEEEREDLETELEDVRFFLSDAEMAVREGPTRPFMDVWFADARQGVAVGAFGMIFRTADGGQHWEPLIRGMDNPDGFHYYALAPAGEHLYLVGEMGLLFRSGDLGRTWERLDSPYEGSFFGVTGDPAGAYVLVYGLGGNTFRSADGGTSWQPVSKPEGTALSAGTVTREGRAVLVTYNGEVLASADRGQSFTDMKGRFPGCIAVLELSDGELLLVGSRGVFRTTLTGADS